MRRSVIGLAGLALVATLTGCSGMAEEGARKRVNQLFADAWEFRLREDPQFATRTGDRRYDDRLRSMRKEDIDRRAETQRAFVERLVAIDRELLSPSDRVNYDIFGRLLEDSIAEYDLRTWLIPITNRGGWHVELAELPGLVSFVDQVDYRNYIDRLRAVGDYADQHIELMREGIREAMVLPRVVLEGYDETIVAHVVSDPTASVFYQPLAEIPATIPVAEQERLRAAGREAIAGVVVPAYERFLEFFRAEYYPATRDSIAADQLPAGREFYEYRVRHFTTLDVTPEDVHEIGLAEVKRLRGAMEKIIREVEFEGSFQEFLEFLRTDDRFYVDTAEELFEKTALVLKRMEGKLPELFGKLPRTPFGLEPVPDYIAPKTTPAYYRAPAGDGSRSGAYFVNTYKLESRPLYEIEALSYHEAVPGHHLQIALQQELEDVPEFRRFGEFTAYVEGWALYSERLGLEVGFFQDPYSDFGRLTYEMWRACRLVVDTGMHYLGWSRQRAIDYMVENTALTKHTVTTEIDRYISWPGQALAYKMGELQITRLRREVEEVLGERFDIRRFHDVVLASGSVPLDVLRANVEAYVDAALTAP